MPPFTQVIFPKKGKTMGCDSDDFRNPQVHEGSAVLNPVGSRLADPMKYDDLKFQALPRQDLATEQARSVYVDADKGLNRIAEMTSVEDALCYAFTALGLKGHRRFYELVASIAVLHSNKNQDYAAQGDPFSNFRECEKAGIRPYDGLLTRLSDKFSRVMTLRNKEKNGQAQSVKSESVVDTLMDQAVYSLIGIALYEEESEEKSNVC